MPLLRARASAGASSAGAARTWLAGWLAHGCAAAVCAASATSACTSYLSGRDMFSVMTCMQWEGGSVGAQRQGVAGHREWLATQSGHREWPVALGRGRSAFVVRALLGVAGEGTEEEQPR